MLRLGFKAELNRNQYVEMSKYIDLRENVSNLKIEEAAKIIKNGGIVVFPTETVYGIGANGLNSEAVEKIYIAKGRKQDNPLILHISNKKMLEEIAQNITTIEEKLIKIDAQAETIESKQKEIDAQAEIILAREKEIERLRNVLKEKQIEV